MGNTWDCCYQNGRSGYWYVLSLYPNLRCMGWQDWNMEVGILEIQTLQPQAPEEIKHKTTRKCCVLCCSYTLIYKLLCAE